jgi:hypothetical protein
MSIYHRFFIDMAEQNYQNPLSSSNISAAMDSFCYRHPKTWCLSGLHNFFQSSDEICIAG